MASNDSSPLLVTDATSLETVIIRDKDGVPVTVRPYTPDDRAALERFYREFEPKRVAQGLPPATPERIREWLSSVLSGGTHLVALRDGLIGHAFVVPTAREGVGEYAVFLHEAHRGRGLGTELNKVAVKTAREAGLKVLWLSVEPRNRRAIRSYEKAGFHFVPETVYSIEPEMELQL